MVSVINYEPRGVPLDVCGRMNTQNSKFRQLEVMGTFPIKQKQPDLLVVCICSLTVCESALLLLGRSFETWRCPKLKFSNYDSACERSYSQLIYKLSILQDCDT